jgi:hypothetical protein
LPTEPAETSTATGEDGLFIPVPSSNFTAPTHGFFPITNIPKQPAELFFKNTTLLPKLKVKHLDVGPVSPERFDEEGELKTISPPALVKPLTTRQRENKKRYRNIVITCNDPPKWAVFVYQNGWLNLPSKFKFFCYSIEKGGNSGKVHVQAYAEVEGYVTMEFLLRCFPFGNFQERAGSVIKAAQYAAKMDETCIFGPFLFGTPKVQGLDESVREVYSKIAEKKYTLREIAEEYPNVHFRGGSNLEKFNALCYEPRNKTEKTDLRVIYGTTGSGKSQWVRDLCNDNNWSYYVKDHTKWWTGYRQQKVVIWDEMDLAELKMGHILSLVDSGETYVEVKGCVIGFKSSFIFATSNVHPQHWWPDEEQCRKDAFMSRISRIQRFENREERTENGRLIHRTTVPNSANSLRSRLDADVTRVERARDAEELLQLYGN